MTKSLRFALAACLLPLMFGCSSQKKATPVEPTPVETAVTDSSRGATGGYDDDAGRGANALDTAAADRLVVYFDFDSSTVRDGDVPRIDALARRLASDSRRTARIEGHTDERGSAEYNIGLGERRAQAVRRLLRLRGATDAQLRTVSYGEERPAVEGSSESAWSQNRRVEIQLSPQP